MTSIAWAKPGSRRHSGQSGEDIARYPCVVARGGRAGKVTTADLGTVLRPDISVGFQRGKHLGNRHQELAGQKRFPNRSAQIAQRPTRQWLRRTRDFLGTRSGSQRVAANSPRPLRPYSVGAGRDRRNFALYDGSDADWVPGPGAVALTSRRTSAAPGLAAPGQDCFSLISTQICRIAMDRSTLLAIPIGLPSPKQIEHRQWVESERHFWPWTSSTRRGRRLA